ncbi:MAG: DUF922 domain-containing protein [Rhizobiaceae bacterium]|nr:DUF922 domain-containing protein [Rhizobiaceae bacterium]
MTPSNSISYLATFLLAGMLSGSVSFAETVSRSYSYFTIGGATPAELESEMSRLGPQIKGSAYRHPGATRMEFASRVGYGSRNGRCKIVSAQVSIKANVILPRWKRPGNADAGARLFWDVLSADIVRHEESHLVIARNHARKLERELKALPARKNCELMSRDAENRKDKIMADHDREQQRFDAIEGAGLEKRLLNKLQREIDARLQAKAAAQNP